MWKKGFEGSVESPSRKTSAFLKLHQKRTNNRWHLKSLNDICNPNPPTKKTGGNIVATCRNAKENSWIQSTCYTPTPHSRTHCLFSSSGWGFFVPAKTSCPLPQGPIWPKWRWFTRIPKVTWHLYYPKKPPSNFISAKKNISNFPACPKFIGSSSLSKMLLIICRSKPRPISQLLAASIKSEADFHCMVVVSNHLRRCIQIIWKNVSRSVIRSLLRLEKDLVMLAMKPITGSYDSIPYWKIICLMKQLLVFAQNFAKKAGTSTRCLDKSLLNIQPLRV